MKNIFNLLIAFLLVGLLACETEQTEQLSGELYFPWLKLGNYYGQPDSVFQYYIQMRDSLGDEELQKQDPAGAQYMRLLEENGLLMQPYVYLKIEGGESAVVFMDSASYEVFTTFDYQKLRLENHKVSVKATVTKLRPLMYKGIKFHRIDKVPGETLPIETKYRIENYQ